MAGPTDIFGAVDAFGGRVNLLEAQAVADLTAGYAAVWERLRASYQPLADRVNAARAAGEPIRPGDLYRMERFTQLMAEAQAAYQGLARQTFAIAQGASGAAIDFAIEDHRRGLEALQKAGVAFPDADWDVSLDREAMLASLGFTSEGSPLRDLFDGFGVDASQRTRRALVSGIVAGKGTDVIARDLRRTLGVNLWRSQLIARTEAHRAYREVGRRAVDQNPQVYDGWVWRAACDSRTCAICWAKHGTTYPAKVPMYTHPGCRCALVPNPRSFASILGEPIPDALAGRRTSGADLFARLTPEAQRKVLGPARFRLYSERGFPLNAFWRDGPKTRWGVTPRLIPLNRLPRDVSAIAPRLHPSQVGLGAAAQGIYPPWVNNAAKRRRYDRYVAANPGVINVPRYAIGRDYPGNTGAPRPAPRPNAPTPLPAILPNGRPAMFVPLANVPHGQVWHPEVPPGGRPMTKGELERQWRLTDQGEPGLTWSPARQRWARINWSTPAKPRVAPAPGPAKLPTVPNPALQAKPAPLFPGEPAKGVVHNGVAVILPAVPVGARPMNSIEMGRQARRQAAGLPALIWKPMLPDLKMGRGRWGAPPGAATPPIPPPRRPTMRRRVVPDPLNPGREIVLPPEPPGARPMNAQEIERQARRAAGAQADLVWKPGAAPGGAGGHWGRPIGAAPTFVKPAPVVQQARVVAAGAPAGPMKLGGAPPPNWMKGPKRRRWLRWQAENPNAAVWRKPPPNYLNKRVPSQTIAKQPLRVRQKAEREPVFAPGKGPKMNAAAIDAKLGQPGWSASAIARAKLPNHPAIPDGARPMNAQEWQRNIDRRRNVLPELIWKRDHWGAPVVVAPARAAYVPPPPRPPKPPTILKPLPAPMQTPQATRTEAHEYTGPLGIRKGGTPPETPVKPITLPPDARQYVPDANVRAELDGWVLTEGHFGSRSTGGVSESYFATFTDPVTGAKRKVQIKPTSGQREGLRDGVLHKSESEREYASYVVNRHLGFPLDHAVSTIRDFGTFMDPATNRPINIGRAIVNEFKEAAGHGYLNSGLTRWSNVPETTRIAAAMHDALIANLDRHGNNYFLWDTSRGNEAHLVAIDPSLSFPFVKDHTDRRGMEAGAQNWTNQAMQLDAPATARLQAFIEDEAAIRAELEPLLGVPVTDDVFKRARWMWQHGRTLTSSELTNLVWWTS